MASHGVLTSPASLPLGSTVPLKTAIFIRPRNTQILFNCIWSRRKLTVSGSGEVRTLNGLTRNASAKRPLSCSDHFQFSDSPLINLINSTDIKDQEIAGVIMFCFKPKRHHSESNRANSLCRRVPKADRHWCLNIKQRERYQELFPFAFSPVFGGESWSRTNNHKFRKICCSEFLKSPSSGPFPASTGTARITYLECCLGMPAVAVPYTKGPCSLPTPDSYRYA